MRQPLFIFKKHPEPQGGSGCFIKILCKTYASSAKYLMVRTIWLV